MISLSDKNEQQRRTGNKSFLILGMGYFGAELARQLYELGADVVGVDSDPQIVARMADHVTQAIEMNPADEQALASLGVADFDVCVIARGSNLEDSVSIAITLKELKAKRIIGRTVRRKHAEILSKLGVDQTVFPEIEIADHMAEKLVKPKIDDKMTLSNGYAVEALMVSDRYRGLTVEAFVKKMPAGVSLLALQRGDEVIALPDGAAVLEETDRIIVCGKGLRLGELER
ncbi:MAG: TrkA family potassium uptake protein [Abditibacteriota bacterium]|nr:TrkA family potassium uptake protein [Abditibacteriota bacterium]